MGAAAFIMAEFLEMPYAAVIAAAAIPAFIYFATIYFMVQFEAEKHGIERIDKSRLPVIWDVLKEGWHLLLSLVVLVGLLAYLKRKGRNVMPTAISVLALLALLFYLVNFGEAAPSGIVHHNSTYLMSGPSAGASVVAIVDEGHMLGVLGKKDVWVHTRWMGQDVYVKENQLLMVGL